MNSEQFNRGDKVRHSARPEWGHGTVDQAVVINHAGKPAQRLVVSFSNRGRVTVNTGVAALTRVGEQAGSGTATATAVKPADLGPDWLSQLEASKRDLSDLPEAMSDPFTSLEARVQTTLAGYRFGADARSLIDWAVAQTQLKDPLSEYSRSELEQAFEQYRRKLDQHLTSLVRQARQERALSIIEQATLNAPNPAARQALRKAMR